MFIKKKMAGQMSQFRLSEFLSVLRYFKDQYKTKVYVNQFS